MTMNVIHGKEIHQWGRWVLYCHSESLSFVSDGVYSIGK